MIFKQGVRITADQHPVTAFAIIAIDAAWLEVTGHEAMCTSADDSTHGTGSLHPLGAAWDLRLWKNNDPAQGPYDRETLGRLVGALRRNLGSLFQIILEGNHIHIEFDPHVELVR